MCTFSDSSSSSRLLAFLFASAAWRSLAATIISIHWWHFFKSSCGDVTINAGKLLKGKVQHWYFNPGIFNKPVKVSPQWTKSICIKPLRFCVTLSEMVAMYLMHSASEGNWLTWRTIHRTTFTWPCEEKSVTMIKFNAFKTAGCGFFYIQWTIRKINLIILTT